MAFRHAWTCRVLNDDSDVAGREPVGRKVFTEYRSLEQRERRELHVGTTLERPAPQTGTMPCFLGGRGRA
jgi:hypothetical protein